MNEVKLIDCMEYMKTVPDKYYELAIVDPPYGINDIWVGGTCNGWGKARREAKNRDWDEKIPDREYFDELLRVSNNQIIWGGNYFTEYLKSSRCWLIWNKPERGFSLSEAELAWTSFDKIVRVFDHYRNEIGRFHPTQKPVALYKWLLKNYAKPGDKIFDSHVGSGSSRIACYDMGFDFTGCELDADYWKAQEERFKSHAMQGDLFSGSDLQSSILGGLS